MNKRAKPYLVKRRAKDFRAGVEAAKYQIAPLLARRYYVRGFFVGLGLGVVATASAVISLNYWVL